MSKRSELVAKAREREAQHHPALCELCDQKALYRSTSVVTGVTYGACRWHRSLLVAINLERVSIEAARHNTFRWGQGPIERGYNVGKKGSRRA